MSVKVLVNSTVVMLRANLQSSRKIGERTGVRYTRKRDAVSIQIPVITVPNKGNMIPCFFGPPNRRSWVHVHYRSTALLCGEGDSVARMPVQEPVIIVIDELGEDVPSDRGTSGCKSDP